MAVRWLWFVLSRGEISTLGDRVGYSGQTELTLRNTAWGASGMSA